MKTLLPLIISGFVLCGFFAVCLSAALLPRSEPEPEPESVSVFDLFPPFQPVYLDFDTDSYSIFSVSVPLESNAFDFSWSYSLGGDSFMSASSESLFTVFDNYLFADKYSGFFNNLLYANSIYIKCDVFEKDSDTLVHTYYFSYQFFNLPSSSAALVSSSRSVLDPEDEPEPEPETEDEPEPEPER